MMKIVNNLIILLFFSLTTFGQTYFNERYSYSSSQSLDFTHDLMHVEDGYIIPGAFTYMDTLAYNKLQLLKIDHFGNEILKNSIGVGDTIYSFNMAYHQGGFKENTYKNSFYGVGMKREYISTGVGVKDIGMILKFNEQLDTLWSVCVGDKVSPIDSNYIFEHCSVLPNNELIITGIVVIEGSTSKALLIKTDSLGNELWRKYFYSGPLNQGINVIATPDGGFALSV